MKKIVLFLSAAFVLLSAVSCTRIAVALTNKKDHIYYKKALLLFVSLNDTNQGMFLFYKLFPSNYS